MPHAPTDTRPAPRGLRRKISSAVALTLAILGGLVAVAPSAFAYHPEPTAQVACVEDQVLLDWTTTSWGGPEMWGPDYYNDDVRVYVQYGTDDAELGGLTDEEIAQGAFTEDSLTFSGQTVLTPPEGATRVRVHSQALAPWGSGDVSIDDPLQTTAWLELPGDCGEEEPPPPVEVEVDATTGYDCDARTTVVVTVTSTGGATTFEVRVDDVPTATLADVTGTSSVDVTIPVDGTSTITVLVGEDVILTESIAPIDCPEVGGVVTQPAPTPTMPVVVPTQTPPAADPVVAAQTLPRTGVPTAMLVAVALALLGLGTAFVTAERRAATVEVDRTDRGA